MLDPRFASLSRAGGVSTRRILLRRLRVILWATLFGGLVFLGLEVALAPALGPHTVVKLCGVISNAAVLVVLRQPWALRHARPLAIGIISMAYAMTAASGALSPSHEYATSATLFVAAALTTATVLPWGLWGQLTTVLAGGASLAANVYRAQGSLWVATSDPGAAVVLAFGMSVVIAHMMQTSRLDAARHQARRRGFEAQTNALNAELERRVRDRTAELAAANLHLKGEIEERRRVADALRDAQRRLIDIIDNSTAVICLKDTEGRYLLVNREFERLSETSRDDVVGKFDIDLWDKAVAEQLHERDEKVLALNAPLSFDEAIPVGDNLRSYASVRFPLHDATGRCYAVGCVATDITLLKEVQEQARRHQQELAHVQRLHVVGEMAAALAHEINQPLGAIANYAQGGAKRLQSGDVDRGALLGAFESITVEAVRAAEVLRGIRRLVSKQEDERVVVDANDLVRRAARVVEPQARASGISLRVDVSDDHVSIRANATQIEQVLVNLLLNAVDAVGASGKGWQQISIYTAEVDAGVEVGVVDTGPGISPAMSDKLFMPFCTTKPHGLGMGLAISRSIVEAHGGNLWKDDNPGGGTTFRFILPLDAQEAARRRRAKGRGSPALRLVRGNL